MVKTPFDRGRVEMEKGNTRRDCLCVQSVVLIRVSGRSLDITRVSWVTNPCISSKQTSKSQALYIIHLYHVASIVAGRMTDDGGALTRRVWRLLTNRRRETRCRSRQRARPADGAVLLAASLRSIIPDLA
jgi:hypothetical protein